MPSRPGPHLLCLNAGGPDPGCRTRPPPSSPSAASLTQRWLRARWAPPRLLQLGRVRLARRVPPHERAEGGDQDGDHSQEQEDRIREYPHPLEGMERPAHQVGETARMPVAVAERIPELQHPARTYFTVPSQAASVCMARRQKTRTARASMPKTPNIAAWPWLPVRRVPT